MHGSDSSPSGPAPRALARRRTLTPTGLPNWKSGEVISDPEAVCNRIKNKHWMFGESREEREVRVDGEHQTLMKGKLTGHQFQPLFEASKADLEAVGLGKCTSRISGRCRRIFRRRFARTSACGPETDGKDVGLRSPATWEESHKVVLEYEQREAAHRAVAHAFCRKRPSVGNSLHWETVETLLQHPSRKKDCAVGKRCGRELTSTRKPRSVRNGLWKETVQPVQPQLGLH